MSKWKTIGSIFLLSFVLVNSFSFSASCKLSSAAHYYTLESSEKLTLTFSSDTRILINIEIEVFDIVNYNFEFKNSLDEVVASRYNVTGNLKMAYIGTGNYTMTITNLKESSLYFSLIKETFPLQTNSETKGYSYKTKLYCWSIDASQSNFHQYPIESLNRRDYFMYFISPEKPSTATVWFAYFNPQTNEDWAEYLEPLSIPGNWKIPVEITKDTNWLVVQLGSTGDFNVIIILRISSEFTLVGKVLVGIASAVVGVVIFVLYYFDPLKFRKRKVRGENYEKYKAQYERVENLQDAVKEVFSSVEEEKRKNK